MRITLFMLIVAAFIVVGCVPCRPPCGSPCAQYCPPPQMHCPQRGFAEIQHPYLDRNGCQRLMSDSALRGHLGLPTEPPTE